MITSLNLSAPLCTIPLYSRKLTHNVLSVIRSSTMSPHSSWWKRLRKCKWKQFPTKTTYPGSLVLLWLMQPCSWAHPFSTSWSGRPEWRNTRSDREFPTNCQQWTKASQRTQCHRWRDSTDSLTLVFWTNISRGKSLHFFLSHSTSTIGTFPMPILCDWTSIKMCK